MSVLRISWLVSAALVLLSPVAHGQSQSGQQHQGFWVGFGLGAGWNTNTDLAGGGRGGLDVYVRLGGTLSQRLLLGGEALAWAQAENNTSLVRANTTFSAMFYPFRAGGLYIKGGLGLAHIETAFVAGRVAGTASTTGFGSTWGLGYDVRLGNNLYLTPNIDLLVQAFDVYGTETTESIAVFTLGLVWH
jgi:hypothetical protein